MNQKFVQPMSLVLVSFLTWISSGCVTAQTNPPPHNPPYPAVWWQPVPVEGAPQWEILPQAAAYNEVILSKRNELGILSNFAPTPFTLNGKRYASLEGFWQAMKFPESSQDPRATFAGLVWPFTRAQVEQMTAFDAKRAGDVGSENMKKMGIKWVTFEGRQLEYKAQGESDFYKGIVIAMRAKLEQNAEVKRILIQTDDLQLRPDHVQAATEPKAWRYYDIWMMLRAELLSGNSAK